MCLQVAVFVILPPGEVWGVYEQSTYLGDRGKKKEICAPKWTLFSYFPALAHAWTVISFQVVGKGIIISNEIVILQYFTPLAEYENIVQ